MFKEFAEYKSKDKSVKVYFANGHSIEGKVLETSPEFVVINNDGTPTVIQMTHILYFHAV